ncbi:MAG: DUF6473 family protein, partial [Pseudomonadota bacterium]
MPRMGLGGALLDVEPCQYGYSRLQFRGPVADESRPYLACIGGTETLGPFQRAPFGQRLAQELRLGCANLGVRNAGADVFLRDPEVLSVARGARAVVLETLSARNLTNVFYRVHPRRNDRVVEVMPALRDRVPELDPADIHFTGHLWAEVARLAPAVFEEMRRTLRALWSERMARLIEGLDGVPVHLVHFGGADALVDASLLEPLSPRVASVTVISPSDAAREEGSSSLGFLPEEAAAAHAMESEASHREAAEALLKAMGAKKTARTG